MAGHGLESSAAVSWEATSREWFAILPQQEEHLRPKEPAPSPGEANASHLLPQAPGGPPILLSLLPVRQPLAPRRREGKAEDVIHQTQFDATFILCPSLRTVPPIDHNLPDLSSHNYKMDIWTALADRAFTVSTK